uniref:Uncharacterized protein LOC111110018 n=1 Tax=Crassostrea virginica TaxID=6565 RepID=A0A8B8BFA1_CRAVI|nr:uncharacterized protein LOC111110018 [Crassostrea virginica]XP_022302033.1 uncharacterized protein LOC111110018 [Crassostrea virginica]
MAGPGSYGVPDEDCIRKTAKCLEWYGQCSYESDHSEHIVKRDVGSASGGAEVSTTPPMQKPDVRTITLSVTVSALTGLILGMIAMCIILWRCKRKDKWVQPKHRPLQSPTYSGNNDHIDDHLPEDRALNKEGDVSIEETRVPTFIQENSVEDVEAGSHSLESTCTGNILTDHPTKPFENHCCQAKT